MGKRTFRWGCLVVGVLILLLLVMGGAWWYFQQRQTVEAPETSPVLVFLLTPSGGDEIKAGNFVEVTLQAVAPEAIVSAELFVDGQSLGMVTDSPESASWTWQAWPVGIHTLSARAAAVDGQVGQSQTVIVNILAGDGVVQVSSEAGQTLEQIGAGLGVPSDQMAGANPHVDPTQPLGDGQPVQIPIGAGGSSDGSGPGGGAIQPPGGGSPVESLIPILITWQFKPTEPVDKSYCYTSSGNGFWEKIPKAPFHFVSGDLNSYTQVGLAFPDQMGTIEAQCWGWLGSVLKFLGQGQTQFDVQAPPNEVMINGDGFVLVGMPKIPTQELKPTGGGIPTIPAPFALREPSNAAECTAHGNPLLGAFICDTLLNASVKQYTILVWEWQPKSCWGGNCIWINEINGYRLYEIDPFTKSEKYLKEISHPGQKVTAIPLPWGVPCYGVRAYVNDPAVQASEMATYCPGQSPVPQKTTLTPTNWLTTGGQWIQDGDCDTYGGADSYLLANKNTGFGNQTGEVLVGSYIVDDDEEDCFRQGDYSGGVKFSQPVFPPGAVIQKALLRFAEISTEYGASGLATNYKLFCVGGVGKAKQDWTGLDPGNHFVSNNVLVSTGYNSPLTSLSGWDSTPEVDVTSVVKGWIQHPENNHGFILTPANAPSPLTDGNGECLSQVGNPLLDIFYFAP